MEKTYYSINENSARIAQEMSSFSDYRAGSATADYRSNVDRVFALAEKIAVERPRRAEKAQYLAERYARRLAANMNDCYRIGCMCPSVMIAGPANFPVKKKERQVAAWDRNHQDYLEIEKIETAIKNLLYGTEVILSDDENAIELLQEKLERLEALQETMKNVNAYYRKNQTLEGCEELTEIQIQKLSAAMKSSWHTEPKPYESFHLTNNSACIRNTRERLEKLKKVKEAGSSETENKYFKVVENSEAMRLQLIFEGKPDEKIRDVLKSNGFRWAPSSSCWQRQLTNNAKWSLKNIIKELDQLKI